MLAVVICVYTEGGVWNQYVEHKVLNYLYLRLMRDFSLLIGVKS